MNKQELELGNGDSERNRFRGSRTCELNMKSVSKTFCQSKGLYSQRKSSIFVMNGPMLSYAVLQHILILKPSHTDGSGPLAVNNGCFGGACCSNLNPVLDMD